MRIIVADDEPDFRVLATRELRREFTDAEIAEIGDPASFERVLQGSPPELLVSDYSLKWTDGFAVLEAVRRLAPQCPAIMFTGTGSEELAVRALKAGFDDYVVKSPRQLRRLAAAARHALDRTAARRELEQTRDLLMAELYHRLHNNLQMVVSLIAFTARTLSDADARAKLDDLGRRVQALSMLQERLYRDGNITQVAFGKYIRQVAEDLLALQQRPVTLRFEGEDSTIPVDAAVPLGLIANELLTNALKHAFGDGNSLGGSAQAEGPNTLTVKVGRDGRGWCLLEVSDNGKGKNEWATAPERSGGLGMRLVRRLVEQLRASFEVEPVEGGGRRYRVVAPSGPAR